MKLPRIWNRVHDRFLGIEIHGPSRGRLWHRVLVQAPMTIDRLRRDALLWLCYRFHPRHRYNRIDTRLPPRYYENPTRLLHGMFAVLCDHVEEYGYEQMVEIIEGLEADLAGGTVGDRPMGDLAIFREEVALYDWWTAARPAQEALLKEMQAALHTKPFVRVADQRNPGGTLTKKPLRERIRAMKNERIEEDTAMMHRLVDLRLNLWA